MTTISGNSPVNPAVSQIQTPDHAAPPASAATEASPAVTVPQDEYQRMVNQPLEQMLQNLGLAKSDLQGKAPALSEAQQGHYNAIVAGFTSEDVGSLQSHMSSMLQSGPTVDYQDVNALVQQVLREAYTQNTQDLRMYAEKVKHFNAQKEAVRDHLSGLREFSTSAREHAVSIGITDMDDPTSWSPEQTSQMQSWFAENSSNGVASAAYTLAHNRSTEQCVQSAQNLIDRAYGTELPDEITTQLSAALESKDPGQIHSALTVVAGYLSYLGDCSVKNGKFGQGSGYDDVHHKTPEPSYEDFQHYMNGAENATARTNLAAGDVEIIEAAFGVELGISGSSSVQDVVAAAMSPVNDKWAHEILHGRNISSAEINQDLATNGPTGDTAIEIFGSVDAAVQAYWGGPINAADPATKMKLELGMPNGVPGPGVSTVAQVEDDIKTWEDKLNSIGDDAQLANVDLQNMLQKQQQTLQMMSNISKALHDTAMAVIRKMGG
ncbi:MAG: hypothetical protein VX834_04180 [Myxococcota bacterium]|nr:hypothetical protein [Myxococcota bacterium]